jgi:hypothetical protein
MHPLLNFTYYRKYIIHKENIPLRPIVSLPGSPTYELSKYLAMILHPLVKTSPRTINNANTFLTNIKDLKLEPDEIMISFEVVSLFTPIPLDTAKRVTNELLRYDESWQTRTKLDTEHDIVLNYSICVFPLNSHSKPLITDKFRVHLWDFLFIVSLLKQSCRI